MLKVYKSELENDKFYLNKNNSLLTAVELFDNVRIHHAKLLKPFLDENKDRLELMFLPAYSPELNLIEGLWDG